MKSTRATALVINNEEILIIHRLRDGNEYYVLPGGSVEVGESPEIAVIRELKEETSIEAKIKSEISRFQDIEGREHIIFECEYGLGIPSLDKDSIELQQTNINNTYEPMWLNISKLSEITMWPEETKGLLINYLRQ